MTPEQKRILKQFRSGELWQTIRQWEGYARQISRGGREAERAAAEFLKLVQRGGASQFLEKAARFIYARAQDEVLRYGLGDVWKGVRMVIEGFASLEPLVKAALGPEQRELNLAMRLIEAFSDQPDVLNWAARVLRGKGFRIIPEGQDLNRVRPYPVEPVAGGKVVIRGKTFPPDHPVVTGEMVRARRSSNVYSFGYDAESGSLFIRFRPSPPPGSGTRAKPDSPGPLYQYFHVPLEVFLALLEAPSKGKAVWDLIRIRGTVSGHRYDYTLAGIVGGYVPRKAVYMGGGEEWYLRRQVVGESGREYVSPLPDMPVRGLPNRGLPGRGGGSL
ncbi:MAG TPA: KTSC domain-containing protein [Phycisphaerae bacterium]|nr:KTSC domain-containing protein [Phycisphaerae bacterium]